MADGEEGGDGAPKYTFVTSDGTVRKEGSRHYTGKATASYPNGELYEGTFVEGIREGRLDAAQMVTGMHKHIHKTL